MPVWDQHRLISAVADQNATLLVANSLGHVRPWLFVIGDGFALAPDREELIASAMRVMAEDELKIFCIDDAQAPLGFRDLEVVEVTTADLQRVRQSSPPQAAAPPPFGGAIDAYSSIDDPFGDDGPGEKLLEVDLRPRRRLWYAGRAGPILLAGTAVFLAIASLGLWFLTGAQQAPLPGRQPSAAVESHDYFLAGVVAALLMIGAGIGIGCWLRRSRRAAGAPRPASALLSNPVRGEGIFISYSHRDSRIAHDLAREVERQGRSAWIFEQQMQGGATGWAAQVVKALRDSQAVMLVGSSNAFDSDQVMREMYLAMEMQKPIVPILTDAAPLPDDFLYILAKFQRHQMAPPLESLVERALADC